MPPEDTDQRRYGRTGPTREMGPEGRRATAPLSRNVGRWALESTRIGPGMPDAGKEVKGQDSPIDLDRIENNVQAGGRVMVTTFGGRFRQAMKSPSTGVETKAGENFSGYLTLAFDEPNNRYILLYADDMGTVSLNTTENWDVEDETLRLHLSDEHMGNYVAEFVTESPTKFSFKLFGADGSELIKSATVRKQ